MIRLVALAFLAACSLGGHKPTYQYYVLSAPAGMTPQAAHSRTLAISQVTIPRYLDREQLATRTAGTQLVYSTTDRWAEPLDEAFERTLRESLAASLAKTPIDVAAHATSSTYDLTVDVLRFERSGPDHVELWARWILHADSEIVDRGETRLRVPLAGSDANSMVAALGVAVGAMGTEVAARVQKVDRIATR